MQITTEQLKALISDNLKDNNHKAEILKQFDLMNNQINFFDTELRRYYGEVDNMKKALFHRNQLIQDIDAENQEKDNEIDNLIYCLKSMADYYLHEKEIDDGELSLLNERVIDLLKNKNAF